MVKHFICITMLIMAFGFAQLERWIYSYNGPGNNADEAFAIIEGLDGNLYAGGQSFVSADNNNFTILSIDTAAQERWVYDYDGPGHSTDGVNSLVYGADTNIYAAGWAHRGLSGYIDFTVISVDTAGNERWVYRYNGVGNYLDNALSIAYGLDGNIYAAGYTFTFAAGVTDFMVVSLTPLGSVRWLYRYDGGGRPWNGANSIVYGLDNHVYAAGYCGGTSSDVDFIVICFDTLGNVEWIYKHNGPGGGDDEARSLVYGPNNTLYAAGYSSGVSSLLDFTVISLTTAGTENWIYRHNGSGNRYDMAKSIVYGQDNNLYAAGFVCETDSDLAVISIDTAGNERWRYLYNGPYNYEDEAFSITYGADNNVYAAGYSYGINTFEDFVVVGLRATGEALGVYRYNGSANLKDWANSIIYGSDNKVYAAGMCFNTNTIVDLLIVSLNPVFDINERSKARVQPLSFEIAPSFFHDRITLQFSGASLKDLRIAIYNVLGELVYYKTIPSVQARYTLKGPEITRLAAGTYFLSIARANDIMTTKTIVKY